MDRLYVFHDDNGSFVDHTREAENYIDGQNISLTMVNAEDYLYVGYEKPIHSIYLDLTTAGGSASETLSGEYYNGSSFVALPSYFDGTDNFTRSGFIDWGTNIDLEEKTTINSQEAYWYRFRPSADHGACVLTGVNIVFSTDNDLKEEIENISDYYGSNSSLIRLHQAARNEIVQRLNNKGYLKVNSAGNRERLDAWDVLDRHEVKQASKYLALSKLFREVSDQVDDKWYQKSLEFHQLFEGAFNLFNVTIDSDDDGKVDSYEKNVISFPRIRRV